jgi:hypothetical protein
MTFARRKKWNVIKKRRKISHQKVIENRANKEKKKE